MDLTLDRTIKTYLTLISETLGERPTGSFNNQKVTALIENIFKDWGYQLKKQTFDCIDWHNAGASLTINNQSIPMRPSYYSKACSVESDYIMVGSIEALKKKNFRNKIVVLYDELTTEQLMPKKFKFYNPEHHQLIIRLLEAGEPLAVLTLVEKGISVIEDGDFDIPSGVVAYQYLPLLMNNSSAKLNINTTTDNSSGENIIATTQPQGKNKIVLTAHIDTKYNTPGALDNATGIIILLMLGERLAVNELNHTIEFAFLNGEDYYSTPGQVQYFNDLKAEAQMIALAINCDGVGLKESYTAISCYGLKPTQRLKINTIVKNFKGVETIDPWQQGDHMLFVMNDIPTIALTSKNIFTMIDEVIHTPKDNQSLVDVEKVIEVIELIEQLIHALNE